MKQIMGIGGGGGNRQRGPVRSYVLYFERLTGWAAEGQGCGGRAVRGSRAQGVHWSRSQIETGVVPAPRAAGTKRTDKRKKTGWRKLGCISWLAAYLATLARFAAHIVPWASLAKTRT